MRIHEKRVAQSPGSNFAFIQQDSILKQAPKDRPRFEHGIFITQTTSCVKQRQEVGLKAQPKLNHRTQIEQTPFLLLEEDPGIKQSLAR